MSEGEWQQQPREPEDRQLSPSDAHRTASTPEPDGGDIGDSIEYDAPDYDADGIDDADGENGILCKVEMVEGDEEIREFGEELEEGPRVKHTCPDCPFETYVRSSLARHRRMHARRPLSCHLCDAHYLDQTSLARHLRTHEGGQEALLPCPECGTHFTRRDTLEQHMMMHAQPEKPFKCSICQESFLTYKEMQAHKSGHGRKAPYVCEVCGKGYLQLSTLVEHRFSHEEERRFPCTLCGKRFFSSMALKRHGRVHTGERPFRCLTCGLNFAIRAHLLAHKRTHTGERPFPCPSETCPQAFSTSSAAKRHFLNIHSKDAQKSAKNTGGQQAAKQGGDGEGCVLGCTDGAGGAENPPAPIPHVCKHCGASFQSRAGLAGHERTHIVLRPFSCPVCPRSFASTGAASRHLRKAHNTTATAIKQAVIRYEPVGPALSSA
uniref:Putative regulation of transcription n=1 Tax=Hyalomma excavatum TaxID=257692 RepID=A0A131XHT9_9ACAR